jgi:superfamily II RNA helicase
MSRIRNDFSMVLNLLLSQSPEDIRNVFEKSLAAYQRTHRRSNRRAREEGLNLLEDFSRHLNFLKAEGFVNENNRLTENGIWASKLRLDQPLLVAESLRQHAFPDNDEKLLAAVIAPFVYDGNHDIKIYEKKSYRKLTRAHNKVVSILRPLSERMKAAGFPVRSLFFWTSALVYDWARGGKWEEIIQKIGIAEGDLAMLILRTADNLRQISSLKETHPEMAALAVKARKVILREPVFFE